MDPDRRPGRPAGHPARRGSGAARFWQLPSLYWLAPNDLTLHALCALAALAGAALLAGRLAGPALVTFFAAYLSLSTACQQFLGFQWDTLLLEVTAAAVLVAPWTWRAANGPEPSWLGVWTLRLVGFKLMFFAGYVKLASGDPTWADLTALTYHYQTQPLPNPLAPVMHRLPPGFHQLSAALTLAVELVLPFAVFTGRGGRLVAFVGSAALLGLLALTGNYGFFQLLSVVLLFTWLDDGALGERRVGAPAQPAARWLVGTAAVALLSLSALRCATQVVGPLPGPLGEVAAVTRPWRVVNSYGLFAVMTTARPELELQGSDDGLTWAPYVLPYKPGPLDRAPPILGPHMPRLDWQLWFAALGDCSRDRWVLAWMVGVLEQRPPVLALFQTDPFPDGPRFVRVVRSRYQFAASGADGWWERGPDELYCPALSAEDADVR